MIEQVSSDKKQASSTVDELPGHIWNFYEDFNLPLSDLYELIDAIDNGELKDISEKMDGQNITFSVKYDDRAEPTLLFFNKGATYRNVIQNKGKNKEGISSHPYPESVKSAFLKAYDALSLAAVPPQKKTMWDDLFLNGRVLIETALLTPENPNTIFYDKPEIKFIQAAAVGPDAVVNEDLYREFISYASDIANESFEMGPTPILNLSRALENTKKYAKAIKNSFSELVSDYGLNEKNTMGDLAEAMVRERLPENIPESMKGPAARRIVTGRASGASARQFAAAGGDWDEFKEILDRRVTFLAESIIPLEKIIQRVGDLAFRNLEFTLKASGIHFEGEAHDPVKFIGEIRSAFQSGHVIADPKEMDKIRVALDRIGEDENLYKNTEGIVFSWKGETKKLTGLFTPINKLRGFFAYGGAKIKDSDSETEMREWVKTKLRSVIFHDSVYPLLSESGIAFGTRKLTRDEVNRTLDKNRSDSFYSQILAPLGLEIEALGSAGDPDHQIVGDIDVMTPTDETPSMLRAKIEKIVGPENVKQFPQHVTVNFIIPETEDPIAIDIVPTQYPDATRYAMKGGTVGGVKASYRNLLFGLTAKILGENESTSDLEVKYTYPLKGGLRKRTRRRDANLKKNQWETDEINWNPSEYIPQLMGVLPDEIISQTNPSGFDKADVDTFEELVGYLKRSGRQDVLSRFEEYIDRYLRQHPETAQKAIDILYDKEEKGEEKMATITEDSLRSLIRKALSEDLVYHSYRFGDLAIDDDSLSPGSITSLADLFEKFKDEGFKKQASLVKILNEELTAIVNFPDKYKSAWETVGEHMLSSLNFIQQTDIEGGPKVATFYDVISPSGVHFSVKTSLKNPGGTSGNTATSSSNLKLSQMKYVLNNPSLKFGVIGCFKTKDKKSIVWEATPSLSGGEIEMPEDLNSPDQMIERQSVIYKVKGNDVEVSFIGTYRGGDIRLEGSAAIKIFGQWENLWIINLMPVEETDVEIEELRLALLRYVGGASDDSLKNILTAMDAAGIEIGIEIKGSPISEHISSSDKNE